jgi:hypothetical protein
LRPAMEIRPFAKRSENIGESAGKEGKVGEG